jgi:hypothetical protein
MNAPQPPAIQAGGVATRCLSIHCNIEQYDIFWSVWHAHEMHGGSSLTRPTSSKAYGFTFKAAERMAFAAHMR